MSHDSLHVTPSNIRDITAAIELDLRDMIILHLGSQKKASELFDEGLWDKCTKRQREDQGFVSEQLQELLYFADFGDLYQLLNSHRNLLPKQLANHLKNITPQLEKLVPVRNRIAHDRPLYYDDCNRTELFIQSILKEQDAIWNNVRIVATRFEKEQSVKDKKSIHNLPLPDYEETGFIGRKKQIENLKRFCLQSPFPVITVFGDGGVGKTALALKAAYDIVDSPECPFEYVVWTSSKTKQLTVQEIKNIENAIRSSVEMFQNVSDHLAPKGMSNPFEEVLNYMSNFKILLILDNLETILDDQIDQFLRNLPSGSKVLTTSRIGIGAYEMPLRLEALDTGEAIQLLRALASNRQVSKLVKMPNSKLEIYCTQMKNSPLFIKWFVAAVQTGRRPEEILDKRDLLLEFCMSNVYDYLSKDSYHVLNSLLCIPGTHRQAVMAYLNEMDATDLERALQQLRTTTMVTISPDPSDLSFESTYELSELARDYLSKRHPVPPEEEKKLRRRLRQLTAAIEDMNTEQESNLFSFYSIQRRSASDLIVAKYLHDALTHAKRKEFKEAEKSIDKARNLAPRYFEVYRVEANVKAQQGSYSAARIAYEAAIELNPQSAPLRYWYAGFLMRYQNDMEEALKEFKEAAKLDPTAFEIQIEIVRANLYLRKYDETRTRLDELLKQTNVMKVPVRRKLYDLNLQFYIRKADYLFSRQDKFGGFNELENLRSAYQSYPPDIIDSMMRQRLEKARPLIRTCSSIMQDNKEHTDRVEKLLKWFYDNVRPNDTKEANSELKDRLQGRIVKLFTGRNFGFIRAGDGQEFFFRRDNIANPNDWNKLQKGCKVFFWPANPADGSSSRAVNVILDDM